MVELTPKSPFADLLPLSFGPMTLSEIEFGQLTLLSPFKGAEGAVSDALKAAHGVALPAEGRSSDRDGCRVIWFGRGQVLVMGPAPPAELSRHAALSDQSDAWACVEFAGPGAVDVLSRLVPLDVRASAFPVGHTARSLIGHMSGSVTCLGPDRFLLMVFRSMAGTLVHELSEAMDTVLARS